MFIYAILRTAAHGLSISCKCFEEPKAACVIFNRDSTTHDCLQGFLLPLSMMQAKGALLERHDHPFVNFTHNYTFPHLAPPHPAPSLPLPKSPFGLHVFWTASRRRSRRRGRATDDLRRNLPFCFLDRRLRYSAKVVSAFGNPL